MITDVQIAPECPHKGCGQVFNDINFRLAVYLNGVFFLVKPEKGIIGFTCPKCQNTIINSASYNDVLKIKDWLDNTFIDIVSCTENEKGEVLLNPKISFEPTLNYLSPFMLSSGVLHEFGIDFFGSTYMDDVSISDEILNHINETKPELKDRYCSFVGDSIKPISMFRTVFWFDEKKISNCLQYENDHGVRIFPRYHYHTGLIESVNSLLEFNYFMGKTFEQAKADHEKENSEALEAINAYAEETNQNYKKLVKESGLNDSQVLIKIIEQNQDRIANDPIIPAKFLKILTSGPAPIENLLTEGVCDYLWSEVKPFENRDFPESFVDEIDDITLKIQTHEKFDKHVKMVKLVRENQNKQYVQDFLRANLVEFLERYEDQIQSNMFSYADVWRLKESFQKKLFKATNIGLMNDMPYAMHREGEGWRIVFNEKPFSGLRGKGFHWIYYIISAPGKKVYYRTLHAQFGDKKQNEDAIEKKDSEGVIQADQLSISDDVVYSNRNEAELENRQTYEKAYRQLSLEKQEAHSKGHSAKVDRKINEISGFLKYLDDKNIQYDLEGYELKIKSRNITATEDSTDTKDSADTKDSTGTKYKIINDKIKKNYRDAMGKIKSIREAKELHNHFSKHIRSEGGAFIYTPSENIKWHIN